MEMNKLLYNYFLCEEEFKALLGSNFRAVELKNSKEFQEHINLFILNPELDSDKRLEAFFESKADEIIKINNPGFFKLKRVEKFNEYWLFIKEYIPGIRLSRIIYKENSPQMSLNVSLYIFKEICEAFTSIQADLSADQNNLHGQIHPFNVVLTEKGEIKLDNYFFGKALSNLATKKDDFLEFYGQNLPVDENEIIQFGPQVDLIQVGMLFLELLMGRKIPRNIPSAEIESLIESSIKIDVSNEEELLKEELVQLIKKTIQIAPEGNFSDFEELSRSLLSILATNKYMPVNSELLIYLSSHLKSEFESLAQLLKSEEKRDYGEEKEGPSEEFNKAIEKMRDLSDQRYYDESLLLIEEALTRFPDKDEIINLKKTIEEEIKQRIEDTKINIRLANYNEALKNINDCLMRSPKRFAGLEKEKKSLEKHLEKKLSKAKKAYEKGKKESALESLKELINIRESDVVKPQIESLQQMIKEIEELPEEKIVPPSPKPVRKPEAEKKLEEAAGKIEESKFEEAEQILNGIMESDPENKEADRLLKLMSAGAEEIPNLFWQNKFDDALLVSSIHLAKSAEKQNILSYIWRVESAVAQKIEKIKSAIKEENYKIALSDINDALTNSPKSFKDLIQLRMNIEQHMKDKFSQAQEEYKKGEKEKSISILKEIKEINETNTVEPSIEAIQKWIDRVEGKKTEFDVKVPAEKAAKEEKREGDFALGIKVKGPSSPLSKKLEKAIGWIKSHPIHLAGGIGGLVVLIGAIVLLPQSGLKKRTPPPPSTGYVLLVKQEGVDYAGLSATIDSSPLPIDQQKAQEIQVGTHTIRFQKGDHFFEKQIHMAKSETSRVRIPLIPLKVSVEPRGEIWEGGNLLKNSDSSHVLYLLPIEYAFTIKESGYQEEVRNITLREGEQQSLLEISLNRAASSLPGTLIVQAFPSGSIYEGNQLLASFPPLKQSINLSPGAHTLKFTTREQGCGDVTKTYQIKPGQTESVTIYLCFGLLNINSTPPGATILIDDNVNDFEGRPYGKTPQAKVKVPVGPHTITLRHPDFPPKTIQLVIQKNETINKSLDLSNE